MGAFSVFLFNVIMLGYIQPGLIKNSPVTTYKIINSLDLRQLLFVDSLGQTVDIIYFDYFLLCMLGQLKTLNQYRTTHK